MQLPSLARTSSSDLDPLHFIRTRVCPPIGNDMNPNNCEESKESCVHDLGLAVNHLYTINPLYTQKHIGKHFSCLTQESNHILGGSALLRGHHVSQDIDDYAKKYTARPQCFARERFFPQTWNMTNKEECKAFFEIFNSEEYKNRKEEENFFYTRRTIETASYGEAEPGLTLFTSPRHQGEQLKKEKMQPAVRQEEPPKGDHREEEAEIRRIWNNGKDCGTVQNNYIIQHDIKNLFHLDKFWYDIRVHMLVASTDPLIVFYYDGFLVVNDKREDWSVLLNDLPLFNLENRNGIYKQEEEYVFEFLKRYEQWTFDRLPPKRLVDDNIISDPDWLNNFLRPQLKKAMLHLVRMANRNVLKNPSMYELFSVDFKLDVNFNLWLIETRPIHELSKYHGLMEDFIAKMLQDHFEIVHGLLRSRMKRIIKYVNELTRSQDKKESGEEGWHIDNADQRREEFKKVVRNSFDDEFLPSPANGFSMIYDGDLDGLERYQGLISEDCL